MGMGAWGPKHGDGSMGECAGVWGHVDRSHFFYYLLQKTFLHRMIQMLFFSHWHESVGMRIDYLFCSLFLDYIFLLVPECEDGLFDL